tara:strand:+ start:1424 stop:1813 length:390 start_codon:yes stop_codon:yes gene_type:complete
MYKLYLVKFKYKGSLYFKGGITSKADVLERFRYDIQKYDLKEFKIMKSSWFRTEAEALDAEQRLFMTIITKFPENNYVDKDGNHRFHNFWLEENLGGISEMRKYNHKEVQEAYKFISENGVRFFKDLVA